MTAVEPIRSLRDIKRVKRILIHQSLRNALIFILGINFGLRISDILALNVEDVREKSYLELREKKTKKFKKIPINSKIRRKLEDYTKGRRGDSPLFITYRNNRLDRISVYRMLKKACKKAKIKERIGTHTMRKTFGYHHYRTFNNIAMLQKIFNHSSMDITLRYIGIEQEQIYTSYANFIL